MEETRVSEGNGAVRRAGLARIATAEFEPPRSQHLLQSTPSRRPRSADADLARLYARLLRATMRATVIGDEEGLVALFQPLSDAHLLEQLWTQELFWNHRSPLLIAREMSRANDAGLLHLPQASVHRLDEIAEAGRRRNALMMNECASVLSALDCPATPLKGAWLVANSVYPDAARMFGDLDFAVDPATTPARIIRDLEGRGYTFRDVGTPVHLAFLREGPGMQLYDGLPALREPTPNFDAHLAMIQKTFFVEVHHDLDPVGSLRRPFYLHAGEGGDGARHLLLLCYHLCKHDFAHPYGVVDIALLARPLILNWGPS
jgi:hypothetical protein